MLYLFQRCNIMILRCSPHKWQLLFCTFSFFEILILSYTYIYLYLYSHISFYNMVLLTKKGKLKSLHNFHKDWGYYIQMHINRASVPNFGTWFRKRLHFWSFRFLYMKRSMWLEDAKKPAWPQNVRTFIR